MPVRFDGALQVLLWVSTGAWPQLSRVLAVPAAASLQRPADCELKGLLHGPLASACFTSSRSVARSRFAVATALRELHAPQLVTISATPSTAARAISGLLPPRLRLSPLCTGVACVSEFCACGSSCTLHAGTVHHRRSDGCTCMQRCAEHVQAQCPNTAHAACCLRYSLIAVPSTPIGRQHGCCWRSHTLCFVLQSEHWATVASLFPRDANSQ